MNYYLKIEGIEGESWTALDGFDFGFVNEEITKVSNTLAQTGTPDFGTINVQLNDNTFLPNFLRFAALDITTDIVIRATVNDPAGLIAGGLPIYDLRLNDVLVRSLFDQTGSGPDLSLAYKDIGVTTYSRIPVISPTTTVPLGTFDWDVANKDTTPTDLPSIPVFTTPDNTNLPTQYTMTINGIGGGSDLKGANGLTGLFDVTDFSFGVGAADPGKGFDGQRFSVAVGNATGLTALMSLAATNKLINAIQIDSVGVDPINPIKTTRQFGDVQIDAIRDDGGVGWLCCTNLMRDSSCESSMVAGGHEQTHTPRLQDQELARV